MRMELASSNRRATPPLDLFSECFGMGELQKLHPRAGDAGLSPLGDGLRRNAAQPGNLRGAAEAINQGAVGVSGVHVAYCKHAYPKSASILSRPFGKLAYMKRTTGERIRDERIARDWTQQELADRIKAHVGEAISRAAIAQWEKGGGLKPESVFAVADVMKISPRWLVHEVGEKQAGEAATAQAPAQYQGYGPSITNEEVAVIRDLRELLPDRIAYYAAEIRKEANVARAYKAMGHPPAVPDDRVAEFIGPAPAVPPVERRSHERRDLSNARRITSEGKHAAPTAGDRRRAK